MPKNHAKNAGLLRVLPEILLLFVAVVWGVNIPVMKIAMATGINAFVFNGIRLIFSAVILGAFAVRSAPADEWSRLQSVRGSVLSYAMLVSVLYQLLFLLAVTSTTSADTALIMATIPLWTAIGARVFLYEQISSNAWLGLVLAFCGTVLVTIGGAPAEGSFEAAGAFESPAASLSAAPDRVQGFAGSLRLRGNLCALAAAMAWAAGTILSRPVLRTIRPLTLSSCSASIGLPLHLLIALTAISGQSSLVFDPAVLGAILYSGLLSSGLTLPMWNFGVHRAGAAQAGLFQNLAPLTAIVAGWLLLSEPLTIHQGGGGTLILGGLLIARRGARR